MGEPNRRAPQVKEAIITLCRIFKYSGICENVAPDDIRLAKFDKPEAVSSENFPSLAQATVSAVVTFLFFHWVIGKCFGKFTESANALQRLQDPMEGI